MAGYRLHWVDIEDHSDALDDVEILTFPTLVVTDTDASILFAGPVEPRTGSLTRLLEALPAKGETSKDNESWADVIAKN